MKRVGKGYRANVQIFPLSGMFICTDFVVSIHKMKKNRFVRSKDDVWAMFAYESPYIAKKVMVRKGDRVLDLATGSGVIAIFCAKKAKRVIATDINPKALHYAKFNATLNNVENKIEFRAGNLFKPVKKLKFDLIVWNGPTLSVPNAPEKYPIYCFGGIDGLAFTRRFIEESPKYLMKKGRMQWLDSSISTEKEPESLK
ncbi:methyltransferase, partial [Candidatus Microgenomates bacterium]|nr:methyltransferase [Candidatus Microgenomates bacterium]